MIGQIEITALTVSTRIGAYAWEQQILQKLRIDLTIETNLNDLGDALENTIDYDNLCQLVTLFVESKSFTLIETVAVEVASLIKEKLNIQKLKIRVSKPHAIANAENVSVILEC